MLHAVCVLNSMKLEIGVQYKKPNAKYVILRIFLWGRFNRVNSILKHTCQPSFCLIYMPSGGPIIS